MADFSKHIPLAALLTAIAQLIAGGIWVGNVNARLEALELAKSTQTGIDSRLVRVEEKQSHMLAVVERIDSRLERLEQEK
jgi:hypothetical protein